MNPVERKSGAHTPRQWQTAATVDDDASGDEIARDADWTWVLYGAKAQPVAVVVARTEAELTERGALIVRAVNAFDPLVSALEGLVEIIDAAGVHNIMRGVPLGSVSWAVKTNDRLDAARAALSLAKDGTK
jgi:hypothetical protein